MKRNINKIFPIILSAIVVLILFGISIFVGKVYRADTTALAALVSDETVTVSEADYGHFFDGPSQDTALILYPGAKVEAKAYAPLCREFADSGMDVCLVDMPFNLAFLGIDKADKIITGMDYDHWYIAGHSLGGVAASHYASDHSDKVDGVILLASFTVHKLDDNLQTILIYGSEDKVLDPEKYQEHFVNVSADSTEFVINGGNHAQFGSYGPQDGDGEATITPREQVKETVDFINKKIREQ